MWETATAPLANKYATRGMGTRVKDSYSSCIFEDFRFDSDSTLKDLRIDCTQAHRLLGSLDFAPTLNNAVVHTRREAPRASPVIVSASALCSARAEQF